MGQRGPKPLPANVLALRGSQKYLHKREGESAAIQPEVAIPGCPPHLLKEARKEWRRITPELEMLGIVSRIDRTALALYCQEYAWWVWHDTALQRDLRLAEERRAAFEADPTHAEQPWTGGDGFMLPTPNGGWAYNPHWVARNKHALLLDKFLASFGLSPSARGRVTASDRQIPLPGMEMPTGGFNAL